MGSYIGNLGSPEMHNFLKEEGVIGNLGSPEMHNLLKEEGS
jgi:hypothetical protein